MVLTSPREEADDKYSDEEILLKAASVEETDSAYIEDGDNLGIDQMEALTKASQQEEPQTVHPHGCSPRMLFRRANSSRGLRTFLSAAILAIYIFFYCEYIPSPDFKSDIDFFAHLPIQVSPPAEGEQGLRKEIPLYVLSASEERWAKFLPPSGVITYRVNNTDTIFNAYIRFFDAESKESIYTGWHGMREKQARCAIGHMFIMDMIASDPRCVHGCMVAEDDVRFPNRVDPRRYIHTWISALGPDFDYVSLYSEYWHKDARMKKRISLLHFLGYPREEVAYVNKGWGTVSYVVTSAGARKLMEPFHSGQYLLDTAIDDYIYWRYYHYNHGTKTYVEQRYPIVHDWTKGKSLINPSRGNIYFR